MTLSGLLQAVLTEPALAQSLDAVGVPALDIQAPPPLRSFVVAGLAEERNQSAARPVLAVTATSREAEELVSALGTLMKPDLVALYPAWETLPHERLSPRADTVGRRLAVLRRLAHPRGEDPVTGPLRVVVAPIRAVLQPQVAGLGELAPVQLKPGDEADLDRVTEQLVDIGYTRTDLVEKRGEFAVRGGILDVFPPTEEHPVRVEFFGDSVEEIRSFAVADQRSLADDGKSLTATHGLWAPPCRELLLTSAVRAKAKALSIEQAQVGRTDLAELLEKLADGTPTEGMEALAPVLVDDLRLVLNEMPAGTHIVVCDPERVRTRAADLVRTSAEFLAASWASAAVGGKTPIDLGGAAYRSVAEVRSLAAELGMPWWTVSPFAVSSDLTPEGNIAPTDVEGSSESQVVIDAIPAKSYRGETEPAVNDIREWLQDDWRVCLIFDGYGPAQRAHEVFAEAGLPTRLTENLTTPPESTIVTIVTGQLGSGFVSQSLHLAVLTESDLTGQRGQSTRDMRRMPSRRRHAIDPLQLRTGDLVVHEHHGVGRYVDMVRRTVHGGEREYLILEYAPARRGQPGDRLFVPTDALELVTRYVGGEAPALNRLGGSDWAKTKGRARKAVREIAAELVRLYSARMASPGYAFGPDTPWQRELEDAFPYVETPDQLGAVDEVKADMEQSVPMDRIICGDVGYGKTEIAIRAAFKAVQDGKQVAVLVPTTLLVQQHFSTFSERYANFPVVVKPLSRFQTDREASEILLSMSEGSVDVIIGTHRLLSSGTQFKNLGLVIVDEEQRFGVEHKEHLKQMRTAVDVLTMSATPIPRTLEMSLTGIREMSTILTPPEERHPVLTYVGPHDDRQISAAIRRELLRDGQVFYIHNRVESIDRAAQRLGNLLPEARIAVAHGQMNEHLLERVVIDFWEKRFDVLVCTTIVESGIDIPNANTLIVERSDTFGLAQLHQLRGRVGRGRERAYAYFFYPPERPLTETAHDRLATIAQHSDLGAGMAVAMKDLEIRGAGNLLGGEQSGHIAGVGFDLYVRLVGEAVADFKGEREHEPAEIKIDLPINAHIPHEYVSGERLRLEAYRRLAAVTDESGLDSVREELLDRYGTPPQPVENLLAVAGLKVLARRFHITEISLQGSLIRISPVTLAESVQLRIKRLYPGSVYKTAVNTLSVPRPRVDPITGQLRSSGGELMRDRALLAWCRALLQAVFEPVIATGS